MSGKRAKKLKAQARKNAMDGSVIGAYEYKRLKKSYKNPHYAPVVVLHPSKPGEKFTGKEILKRIAEEKKKIV